MIKIRDATTGFTLIELITVLAIFAVLTAIIVPVFGRAQKSARQTACITNLKQIGMALKMYRIDNKWYPGVIAGGDPAAVANGGLYPDYISNKKIFKCSEDQSANENSYYNWVANVSCTVSGHPATHTGPLPNDNNKNVDDDIDDFDVIKCTQNHFRNILLELSGEVTLE